MERMQPLTDALFYVLLALRQPKHGYGIIQEVQELTNGRLVLGAYQGCNEEFQNAMKNYFEGKASKEEALDLFYKAVTEKYPELTY